MNTIKTITFFPIPIENKDYVPNKRTSQTNVIFWKSDENDASTRIRTSVVGMKLDDLEDRDRLVIKISLSDRSNIQDTVRKLFEVLVSHTGAPSDDFRVIKGEPK